MPPPTTLPTPARRHGAQVMYVRDFNCEQHSASSSATEHVGKSTSGSIVGKGEWGEDKSGVRVREERLKERLKKWEKGDRLLLADELPALPSNSSSSENTPSPWDGMQ